MGESYVEYKLNSAIERAMTRVIMQYLPERYCLCKDGPYKTKLKRSVKRYRAKVTPAFERYMIKKRKGELADPDEEFDGCKYFPKTFRENENTLRYRFVCGRPWDHEVEKSDNLAGRCDQNSFLGFVDDKTAKPDPDAVMPEDKNAVNVVWDMFDDKHIRPSERNSYVFKHTAYVPDVIYKDAKDAMAKWGEYTSPPEGLKRRAEMPAPHTPPQPKRALNSPPPLIPKQQRHYSNLTEGTNAATGPPPRAARKLFSNTPVELHYEEQDEQLSQTTTTRRGSF